MKLIRHSSGISWYNADHIAAPHAFFLRHGGVSAGALASLNFSGSLDDPERVEENRKRALNALGWDAENVSFLKQIHSTIVCEARPGQQEGDALVTTQKGLALAVSGADCYPVLFYDPFAEVAGAAHCGWKGTLGRLPLEVIRVMCSKGSKPENIRVAIGPGIAGENYEVSEELIASFRAAGYPETCFAGRQLFLSRCISSDLQEGGIGPSHIQVLGQCTTHPDFFSHRRDKGHTGRLWSVISL